VNALPDREPVEGISFNILLYIINFHVLIILIILSTLFFNSFFFFIAKHDFLNNYCILLLAFSLISKLVSLTVHG